MVLVALRLAWPSLLTPWRSPVVRWRMETYGVCDAEGRLLHAEEVTAARFVRFCLSHRVALRRMVRWAALL